MDQQQEQEEQQIHESSRDPTQGREYFNLFPNVSEEQAPKKITPNSRYEVLQDYEEEKVPPEPKSASSSTLIITSTAPKVKRTSYVITLEDELSEMPFHEVVD